MLKLVIFDWDDVFTQGSIAGYYKCYHEALIGVGIHLEPEDEERRIATKWGAGHVAQLQDLLPEHPELISKAVAIYEQHYFGNTFVDGLGIVPGSQQFLKQMAKKYKLAIASGAHPNVLKDRLIPRFKLPDVIDQIVTIYDLDDVAHAKPHPFMVQKIMRTQGVSPDETIMVGDAKNDVLMARNAGVEPVVVLTGHLTTAQAEALHVKHIIDNVTLLQPALAKIEAERTY
jgi:phosphoglycolate phosphatase-like HAD superfamily hydrolase